MIALGADHGGFFVKEEIKKYFDEIDVKYKDFGTNSIERTDYPIYAEKVAKAIQEKECDSRNFNLQKWCGNDNCSK